MTEMTDEQMLDFLLDLDESGTSVTKWEADFLGNILTNKVRSFSPKQREVIDKLYIRYTGGGTV